MRKYILQIDSVNSFNEIKKINSGFEKLLFQNKKWENYYYAALTNVLLAFQSKGKDIDAFCEIADRHLSKADSLNKNNSEITVIMAMSAAAKINADISGRGIKYGSLANKLSDKAISQNENNPRAYLIKAKSLYNTPAIAGGGPKAAEKYYQKALEKYRTFKAQNDMAPDWGLTMAGRELKEIELKLKSK